MIDKNATNTHLPFLKWAGGKRWLNEIIHRKVNVSGFNRYVEPFLGSGAVFFSAIPKSAILSDINDDLINCYLVIRDHWQEIEKCLSAHHSLHSKEHYYAVRDSAPSNKVERAARFIYLNRTCWNGLYRVNRDGKFNVPIGTKSNVVLDTDNFESIAKLLKNAQIICSDFEPIVSKCGSGDLIFADPPYTVKHNNNGFIKYNERMFSWNDQIRLSTSLASAIERGATVVATNAAHNCIRDLYRGFRQETLLRSSVISAKNEGRGHYEELFLIGEAGCTIC